MAGPMKSAAHTAPEKVKGVLLVDEDGADVEVTRICTVEGRTYYHVQTERAAFEFYVTTKGLIRGLDYAKRI